jgi:sulfate/thiosulfate transport system substrate-binding protein
MRLRMMLLGLVALPAAILATACGGTGAAEGGGGSADENLTLVAYSTPREAYEEIIPLFAESTPGSGVSFDQSYGSSGEQSRAVEQGLPADVVAFSLEPDVTRLVDAGLVAEDWAANDYKGMVTNSVVVLVTREGNPEGIQGWDDLVRDDVEVINANPFTSGGARWNIMAGYGAQLEQGKTPDEAVDYLDELFHHVSVQDKSARESLQTFAAGKGDVLLAYENEAITAQQKGEDLDYVIPDQTILIENPIAVVTESDHPETAQAFVDFLYTPEAQEIFVSKGYRPVVEDVPGAEEFPTPPELFTIEEFGGWDAVMDEFFDRDDGILADIERDVGVAVD